MNGIIAVLILCLVTGWPIFMSRLLFSLVQFLLNTKFHIVKGKWSVILLSSSLFKELQKKKRFLKRFIFISFVKQKSINYKLEGCLLLLIFKLFFSIHLWHFKVYTKEKLYFCVIKKLKLWKLLCLCIFPVM